MTDLTNLIPSHEPSEDTLATVGGMALDAIPLVGPLAGRALDHALAMRERERRREFDLAIVGEVQRLAEQAETALTVADVVSSDEFLATLARTRREAAETASTTKRQRLARAAVSSLDPGAPSRAEREGYLRLIIELDDLHIWLLSYFVHPRKWLETHDLAHTYANVSAGSPALPLEAALGHFGHTSSAPVENALADIQRRGLVDVPLRTFMSQSGMLQPRITSRGRALLHFLNQGNAADAVPPAA
ncbi:hypothetical protein JF550_13670 [Microbacterium esteraromaticum]|uniref:Uncharacterized protein n=1 Tax=Microbacterium esteraromaticum TaxID=57043 RepID=A0A939DXY0_9MICO|nr:hypothetical protein [Microbacterium esteraromaticum]MBN8206997.1 hypothetical protein [Microbacterium esteraromaticum]MBN8417152.1 hypothetical protein [Microbacterium esteraromaticum]